jgi:protein-disulfide isomerase
MNEDKKLSKKEKREQRRLKKIEKQKKEARKQMMVKFGWGLAGLALVGVFIGFLFQSTVPIAESEKNKPINQFTDNDWIKGNSDAEVKIVEYSDFQCPACSAYAPMIEAFVNDHIDEIGLAYRHFPLKSIHPNAEIAAQAAEAAGKQEKFWEMHNLLFENQESWSATTNPKRYFTEYAEALDLNIDQFNKDMGSKEVRGLVKADLLSAEENRLNSTPSFIINGEKIDNPKSVEELKQIMLEITGVELTIIQDSKVDEATKSAVVVEGDEE